MKKIFTINLIALSLFNLPQAVHAAESNYVLLAPLQGAGQGGSAIKESVSGFAEYAQLAFRIGVGFAGLLTVVILIYAGIEYTLSGANEALKGSARKRMEDAMTGLILAVSGYLILQTINPELVKFNLNIPEIVVPGGSGAGGSSANPSGSVENPDDPQYHPQPLTYDPDPFTKNHQRPVLPGVSSNDIAPSGDPNTIAFREQKEQLKIKANFISNSISNRACGTQVNCSTAVKFTTNNTGQLIIRGSPLANYGIQPSDRRGYQPTNGQTQTISNTLGVYNLTYRESDNSWVVSDN